MQQPMPAPTDSTALMITIATRVSIVTALFAQEPVLHSEPNSSQPSVCAPNQPPVKPLAAEIPAPDPSKMV
jgi:hypothetical protein